jgi:hypothetical protein
MATNRSPQRPRTKPPVPRRKMFNVDQLEREVTHEPFVAIAGGEEFVFQDPTDIDWQYAVSLDPNDIVQAIRSWLGDDDYKRFEAHRMELWKLIELSKRIQEHYGLTPDSQGKDGDSPTS